MSKPKFTAERPMETWRSPDGWEWRVLRKYQKNDAHLYARWFCFVTSPICPEGEYGDVYAASVISGIDPAFGGMCPHLPGVRQ